MKNEILKLSQSHHKIRENRCELLDRFVAVAVDYLGKHPESEIKQTPAAAAYDYESYSGKRFMNFNSKHGRFSIHINEQQLLDLFNAKANATKVSCAKVNGGQGCDIRALIGIVSAILIKINKDTGLKIYLESFECPDLSSMDDKGFFNFQIKKNDSDLLITLFIGSNLQKDVFVPVRNNGLGRTSREFLFIADVGLSDKSLKQMKKGSKIYFDHATRCSLVCDNISVEFEVP